MSERVLGQEHPMDAAVPNTKGMRNHGILSEIWLRPYESKASGMPILVHWETVSGDLVSRRKSVIILDPSTRPGTTRLITEFWGMREHDCFLTSKITEQTRCSLTMKHDQQAPTTREEIKMVEELKNNLVWHIQRN